MNELAEPTIGVAPRPEFITVPHRDHSTGTLAANLVLGLLGLLFFLPLIWLISASIDSNPSIALRVTHLTLRYFWGFLTQSQIGVIDYSHGLHSLRNSLWLAGVATLIATPLGVLAAYPLSRKRIPLKRSLLVVILFLTALPVTMLIVPIFEIYIRLGWLNSPTAIAIFFAASSLPLATWISKNGIDAIPLEIEEAAALEGSGTLKIVARVIFPLALPSIGVSAIFTFVNAWGAFLMPFILDNRPEDLPGTIAIYQFIGFRGTYQFGPIAAYSILFSLPVVALYLILARNLSRGFSFSGGVKG